MDIFPILVALARWENVLDATTVIHKMRVDAEWGEELARNCEDIRAPDAEVRPLRNIVRYTVCLLDRFFSR